MPALLDSSVGKWIRKFPWPSSYKDDDKISTSEGQGPPASPPPSSIFAQDTVSLIMSNSSTVLVSSKIPPKRISAVQIRCSAFCHTCQELMRHTKTRTIRRGRFCPKHACKLTHPSNLIASGWDEWYVEECDYTKGERVLQFC
ncbi:hypothetical protein JTE90_011755 [Oedothorax gibbosus]|uniref:Uncharacterized protein n=1 Tax=Oedothorax gibbosus TaxID=931172 RepID=A0AAV6VR11_9ARAC|nr:hypothetical protein JTE90_011755 [Oedothorax gibbosus]